MLKQFHAEESKKWLLKAASGHVLLQVSACMQAPVPHLQRCRMLCSHEPVVGQHSLLLLQSCAWPYAGTCPDLFVLVQTYEHLMKDHGGVCVWCHCWHRAEMTCSEGPLCSSSSTDVHTNIGEVIMIWGFLSQWSLFLWKQRKKTKATLILQVSFITCNACLR